MGTCVSQGRVGGRESSRRLRTEHGSRVGLSVTTHESKN